MLITVLQPIESGRSHVYSHVTTNIQFHIGNNATLECIQASILCLPQEGSTKFAISWRKHDKQMTSPQRWASLVAVVLPHSFGCVAGPAVRSVRFFWRSVALTCSSLYSLIQAHSIWIIDWRNSGCVLKERGTQRPTASKNKHQWMILIQAECDLFFWREKRIPTPPWSCHIKWSSHFWKRPECVSF